MNQPVLAFDLGGTWFRSALVDADLQVSAARRVKAISIHSHNTRTARQAKEDLVEFLLKACRMHPRCEVVSISLGAAYNPLSDLALASAPLWGDSDEEFPLIQILQRHEPGVRWHVVNDVTALALRASRMPPLLGKSFILITLSSGVAARHIIQPGPTIPVDKHCGVQGEIGHLPASASFQQAPLHIMCDCGSLDHLASYVSGRGLDRCLLHDDVIVFGLRWDQRWTSMSGYRRLESFRNAIQSAEPWACSLLSSLVKPLFDVLVTMITVDPESRIVFTGGLFDFLKAPIIDALLKYAAVTGPYLIQMNPAWLKERTIFCNADDQGGLIGAAIYAGQAESGRNLYKWYDGPAVELQK